MPEELFGSGWLLGVGRVAHACTGITDFIQGVMFFNDMKIGGTHVVDVHDKWEELGLI